MTRLLCILPIALLSSFAWASVQDLSDDLTVSMVVQQNGFELNLTPKAHDTPEVLYRPNVRGLFGYQFSYKWFAIAAMFDMEPNAEEERLKGQTSYEDIRGGLFLGKKNRFPILAYYNRYDDLYIENSREIDNSIGPGEPMIQRDDISVFNTGITGMYIFSPDDFSAAASYLQSARQTKSGGSFLATISLDATKINADSPLVPTSLQSSFGSDALIEDGEFITLAASVGYGYTLVFLKNGFATLTLLFGEGVQTRKFSVAGAESSGTAKSFKQSLGLSIGANMRSFFTGFTFLLDQTNYETDSVEFKTKLETMRLFLGYRF